MHIDHNDLGLNFLENLVGHAKRVVIRRHKHAPLQIDHGIGHLALEPLIHARAWHIRRVIRGPQHATSRTVAVPFHHLEVIDDLALIPDVVSRRDHVDVELEKLLRQRGSDPETGGGVLSVRNDQIDAALAHDPRQPFLDDGSPRPPKDVADEEYAHESPTKFDGNTYAAAR